MGGIMSKKRKKRKRERNEEILEPVYEEPQYMEIGFERDNLSVVSHITLPSSDSAFSERSSTLDRTSSLRSAVISDESVVSACSATACKIPYKTYKTYKDNEGGHDDDDDDDSDDSYDYSDVHSYTSVSDTSIKEKAAKTGIPLEEVPFMVEAFQPLLERTIDVFEVIPHLSFIEVHEFARVDDPRRGVEMLIARIQASDVPGKWQAFLHALSVTEYEYIVSLLRGETEEDHAVNRELLRLFTPQIMNRVDPEEFIDYLLERKVINERDTEEVRCEKERRGAISASLMLLHKVPRRISNWFSVFLEVLKKCGMEDLVGHFQIPEISTITRTSVKHTRFPQKKKRISTIRMLRNTDLDYLTPIYETEREPSPPLPQRRPVPSLILPEDVYTDLAFTSRTKIENLQRKKQSLQRQLDEKKLIRQLEMEVRVLQKELDEPNTDPDEEAENISKDTSRENTPSNNSSNGDNTETVPGERFMENNSDILNGNPTEGTEIPENYIGDDNDDQQATEMKENYENSNQFHNNQGQMMFLEQINQLVIDVKEIKQDIFGMEKRVTDAVLKCIISSTTRPASYEDYSYVTVEPLQNIQPVMLYNITGKQSNGLLRPAFHYIPSQYSVDSAMFSDYVRPSNFSVYA